MMIKVLVPNFREELQDAVLDQDMRDQLDSLMAMGQDGEIGSKLSSSVFVIMESVSPISPLGWVHVYKSDLGKIECSLR